MSPSEAAAWLRDKARDFKGLEVKILNLQHRAAVATGKLPDGSEERAAGRVVVRRIGSLLTGHQRLLNQLDRLTPHIPALQNPTLGVLIAVPVAWAGAVIALALAMAALFRRVTAEERAVRLLERGRITAAEAVELVQNIEGRAPFFGLPPWALPAAAVAVGAYIYQTSR